MPTDPSDEIDPLPDDDLIWAKPLVDEAAAELDRGEGIPGDLAFALIRRVLEN